MPGALAGDKEALGKIGTLHPDTAYVRFWVNYSGRQPGDFYFTQCMIGADGGGTYD